MKKKVTMQQIADYLGVSKFVVSKALSGKGGVSPSTQERVFEVAAQLGYISKKKVHTNQFQIDRPEGLNSEKQTVLILMPNVRYQTKESTYWGKIVDGITVGLKKAGLGIVILTENSAENFSKIINIKAFLGVIGVGYISTSLLLEVNQFGIPIILVDHEDHLIPTDTLFINNIDSTLSITNHLIGLGHQSLCFVGNNEYSRSFYDRWLGFRTALENLNIETDKKDQFITISGTDNAEDMNQIAAWLSKKGKALPTALVCANDAIARSAVKACENMNIKVPKEISVTGFDNTIDSYADSPTITTVNVPKEDIGIRAVEMLLRRVKQVTAPYEKIMLVSSIIYRDSINTLKTESRGNTVKS